MISGMAGRYATALFELALEEKAVDAVRKDLDSFEELIVGSDDLNRLLRSPVFGADEQLKALSAILAKAEIKGLAAHFLKVVAAHPPTVPHGGRDSPLSRAGRPPQGRGERADHRSREVQREESQCAQERAQIRHRRGRQCT